MDNKSWLEYMKKKSFAEKLQAFGYACESSVRNEWYSHEYENSVDGGNYYKNEAKAQRERADMMYREIISEYEKAKGDAE